MVRYGRAALLFSICAKLSRGGSFISRGASYYRRQENFSPSHQHSFLGGSRRFLMCSAFDHATDLPDSDSAKSHDSVVGNFDVLEVKVHEEVGEQLVLREFSMPLQDSPEAYERKVRWECLREDGSAASLVRWHVSKADEDTGRAHVEVKSSMDKIRHFGAPRSFPNASREMRCAYPVELCVHTNKCLQKFSLGRVYSTNVLSAGTDLDKHSRISGPLNEKYWPMIIIVKTSKYS